MCYNVWNRIFAENATKILKKIRQNMNELAPVDKENLKPYLCTASMAQ
jgi:hypothetical protein